MRGKIVWFRSFKYPSGPLDRRWPVAHLVRRHSGHPTLSAAQGLSSANLRAVYHVSVFITYFMKILHLVQKSSEVNQSRHTAMGDKVMQVYLAVWEVHSTSTR
jgi:hypothetical protein